MNAVTYYRAAYLLALCLAAVLSACLAVTYHELELLRQDHLLLQENFQRKDAWFNQQMEDCQCVTDWKGFTRIQPTKVKL